MSPGITGFFDESPGVRSMTRLVLFIFALGILVTILTLCVVAVRGAFGDKDTTGMVAAIAAPLTAMFGGLWGVARERNNGASDPQEPTP